MSNRQVNTTVSSPTIADRERFEKFTQEAIAEFPQARLLPSTTEFLAWQSAPPACGHGCEALRQNAYRSQVEIENGATAHSSVALGLS